MKLTEDTNIEIEVKRYSQYLNLVVGVLIFSITMGCLGLPNPQKAALFSLPIVLGLILSLTNAFPETVRIMRDLIKETNDTEEKSSLKKELKEHMDLKWVFNNIVFFWAYLSYFAVLLYPSYATWLKST